MGTVGAILLVVCLISFGYWFGSKFEDSHTYIHLKTEGIYTLLHMGKMKNPNGEWVSAVTYQSHKDGAIYTRSYDSFCENFMNIKEYNKKK